MIENELINKKTVERLYLKEGKSCSEVAAYFGYAKNSSTGSDILKKFNIQSRPFSTKGILGLNKGKVISEKTKEILRQQHLGKKLSPQLKELAIKNFVKHRNEIRLPNGTIVKSHSGYQQIKINDRYIYFHRYIAEQKYGRKLDKGEEVHHINFNPEDNRPENLIVLPRREHLLLHSQLEYVMRQLMDKGIVIFEDNKYKLTK